MTNETELEKLKAWVCEQFNASPKKKGHDITSTDLWIQVRKEQYVQ